VLNEFTVSLNFEVYIRNKRTWSKTQEIKAERHLFELKNTTRVLENICSERSVL
jgi:hypothetical protein